MDEPRQPAVERFIAARKDTNRESAEHTRPSLFRFSLLTWMLTTLLAGGLLRLDTWAYESFRGTNHLNTSFVIISIAQVFILIPAALICEILVRKSREHL